MKKSIKIIVILLTLMLFAAPILVSAKTESNNSFFYIAAKKNTNNSINKSSATYNNDQTCNGDNSILGSVNDESSVAWLLQTILDYIKVIGPVLVVVLSGVEFAKVIIQSDDEAMAKAKKKLITRLLLVAALFFIPTLVTIVLDIFGITSDATCDLK